jgi:hypothetical protein
MIVMQLMIQNESGRSIPDYELSLNGLFGSEPFGRSGG